MSDSAEWVLIQQCRQGRSRSYEPLVLAYQGEATALAEAFLGDSDDAADAVQEAFVRAYRGLGRLADGSQFGPWFRSIVRNLCLDRLRAASRRRRESIDDGPALEIGVDPVGTDRLEAAQLSETVWRALSRLSVAHREILVLKEMEGLSYAEMAQVLGIAEGTVASRVFHARAALRRELAKQGIRSMESAG